MNSLTEENYLKAVYRLSKEGKAKISLTVIAEELNVNPASVVDMIRRLTDKKLISYDKIKGVRLTEKGNKIAINIVRNHRLWEVFLLEKLEYSWDEVHDIAEQLEHIKHPQLADRLSKFLGYPKYDPHGDPIPQSGGEIPATVTTLLSETEKGKSYRVAAVKDTSTIFLQYLQQLNVNIGTKIRVIDKIGFDGSMIIQIGKGEKTTVSDKFADNLFVAE